MDALRTFPILYNLSKRELYEKIIQDVLDGKTGDIHPDAYHAYSENLRKAVGGVFPQGNPGDPYFDLEAQLQANVSRFSAYKAYHLTEQLKKKHDEWGDGDDFKKVAKAVLNTFNRYQAAEYNTATARARTAKQWTDFNSDPIANELYPNLKWLPSRSANPREEHIPFYGLVLPKTDPFWQHNQPGNLWNCKCDWEETDDPAATTRPATICAKGLEGNPAETGEIFGENCTYFTQSGRNRRERDITERKCENATRPNIIKTARERLLNTETQCMINGEYHSVMFISQGICEYAQSMQGVRNTYWLKNEILPKINDYIETSECIGRKVSDTSHNTRPQTLRLKRNTDYFYYFKTELPDGNIVYLHLGRYKTGHERAGKFYLYTITKSLPENIETP